MKKQNKIEKILDKKYILRTFKRKGALYFPSLKDKNILEVEIARSSPPWMKESCSARYKITFSNKSHKILRATAYFDGSKRRVFKLMKGIYSKVFNKGKFLIPRPLDYLKESEAFLYEEVEGESLASILGKGKPPNSVFEDMAKFLSKLHSLKGPKNKALILSLEDYKRAFKRIKKIIPSLEKYFIPLKKIAFLRNLKKGNYFLHADLYPGNVVLGKNKIFFIDFDKAGRGSFLVDLVPVCFSLEFPKSIWSLNLKPNESKELQNVFLKTYCKNRDLSFLKVKNQLDKLKIKVFLDALHFVTGFAYNSWKIIDKNAKEKFKSDLTTLLRKINNQFSKL